MQRTALHHSFPRVTRALPLALAVCAALALGACGGKEEAPAAAAKPTVAAPAATPAAPAAAPAAPAPQVAALPVPELLKNATLAVAEERLILPAGNNAIEFYLAVILQEPNNVQATQALVDLFPLVASIAERAIAQKDVAEAERIVAMLDKASPESYTVTTIKTKLEQLKLTIQREEERKVAAEAAAAQAEQLAAQQAAAQREAAPPPAPEPERAAPAPAAPPPTQVAAATPPPAQTPPPTPAAPAVESRDAQILCSVQPQYPADAVRKRQEGWVELEFTVGADGKVSNVSVAKAQPTRIFDREAIRAMQQWTFRPAVRDGQAIESRRKQRMEFKLGG